MAIVKAVYHTPKKDGSYDDVYFRTSVDQVVDLPEKLDAKVKTAMAESGANLLPQLVITTLTGSTVTVKQGDISYTPIESDGKWTVDIPKLGEWTVHAEKPGVFSRNVTVTVDAVKQYNVHVSHGVRYGYRIKKAEGDPSGRVEYLYDAVGLTPAKMDFTAGKFDYGSWGDKWFVTKNKPCMIKSNGTLDYYLKADDYAYREDGTSSDVANTAYDGNAMSQIPLCWVYRYEDDTYEYEIISDIKYDDNYKAYAHTRADGSIADYFYYSIFGSSGNATKMRSLSGQSLANGLTAEQEIAGCRANGAKWYTHTWSQRALLRTLCILMGKSTDVQGVFGYGNCRSASDAGGLLKTGTLNTKGQFFGSNNSSSQVKVFHIEKLWGDQWDRTAGVIYNNGQLWMKMTPEGQGYRINDVIGYTDTGVSIGGSSGGYISKGTCSEYGFLPTTVSGSGSTYYADGCWFDGSGLRYGLCGASAHNTSAFGGVSSLSVDDPPAGTYWNCGCGLSCEQPATA